MNIMKKTVLVIAALCFSILITSCKTEEKKPTALEKKAGMSLKTSKTSIHWTAYKTTDKIAVNGSFKTVNITKNGYGNTIKEAINNTEFSIPVSSLFSANDDRDSKLKKFFFGMMDNTELLSGTLVIESESTGHAMITMNGITKKLPFTYIVARNTFSLNAVMNLDNWNAKGAIDSLNEACKDLHKSADGISKTWSQVDIQITSIFKFI